MTYSVKEIFYSLQGEGAHTGRPSVFCRFSGCNLWNGKESDRSKSICDFCDTDFIGVDGNGGGKFKNAEHLADAIKEKWISMSEGKPYVVFTGGEPLLQLDEQLINKMHDRGFEVAVETNGTIIAPLGIDWICVSPKSNSKILQKSGNELKLVHPQKNINPKDVLDYNFDHFYLQPMSDKNEKFNVRSTLEYCLSHPKWSLSLQTHKFLNIP